MKWEYLVEELDSDIFNMKAVLKLEQEYLTDLGKQEWELVSVYAHPELNTRTYYLKRPIEDDSDDDDYPEFDAIYPRPDK